MTVFFRSLLLISVAFLPPQSAFAAESLSPEEFVSLAVKQNLDIHIAKAESEEASAVGQGLRIPAPSVSVTQMNMQGGNAKGWQASQTIPFPTKISRDYSARQYAREAQKNEELAVEQEVRSQAKFLYFLVWEAQEQESILQEKKKVLNTHIRIAKSVAQSDTFAKIHVLKAEAELDRLENELGSVSLAHQERLTMAAQLLNKEPGAFKFMAKNPGLSQTPNISSVEEAPQIQAMLKRVKSFESLEKASRSEWLPDFTVSYAHMGETMRFPENNQIMLGITLPFLYFWQADAKTSESSAQRLKTEINLSKAKRNIQAEKVNLEKALQTLKNQISTFRDKILPKALKRKKLFQNLAPRDLSSLQEHLETHLSVPDIQLQILQLQSKYEQAVALLSRYKIEKGGSH